MTSRSTYNKPVRSVTEESIAKEAADPGSLPAAESIVFLKGPPADSHIPAPPAGFKPPSGTLYRGVTPKTSHLAALPDVVDELNRSTDFDQIFGKTAPPLKVLKEAFGAAAGWSLQRAQMRAWDLYCRTQEGLAWREARKMMDRMAPAFELATTTDSTVASQYPGFARLFDASKQIAKKGAATRKANDALLAEGETPVKGVVGKKRKKADDQAIIDAAQAQEKAPPATTNGSTPS
jgi:hypothetical protein